LGSRPIFQAVMKLGWLNRVERFPEAICVFYHATFQEYFAALAVDDWDYFLPRNHVNFPVAGKEYRVFEPQWKQVILLWLGRGDIADEEKEAFIQKLINFDDGCREWSLRKSARGFYAYQSYFLATFCIGEFKHCSVVFDIVKSIVKRGFGYFSIDKQKWRFFGTPIQEQARKTISETIRQLAITELIEIIENCPDQSSVYQRNRLEAAEILGKIDLGHPKAIATLVQILENSEDKDIRKRAAESLHKVGQGNPKVITGQAKFMETDKSENTHNIASEDLVEIALKNPNASASLLELMEENRQDQDTCHRAIIYLEQIGQGHSSVIDGLVKVIENTEDDFIRHVAACTLERIGRGNPYAITTLIKLIENSDFEYILVLVARILGHIQQENPYAITTLVQLIRHLQNRNGEG
jgi:hypothetical protein